MTQVRRLGERGGSAIGVGVVYGLLTGVAVLDLATALGFAAAMLYVPVVLVAIRLVGARHAGIVAGISVVLTGGALWWAPDPPAGLPQTYYLGNRVVTMIAIATCGWLGTVMLHTRARLEQSDESLREARARVARQTRLLEIAGEVGRFGGWSVDVRRDSIHWSDEVARIHGLDAEGIRTVDTGISYYVPEDRARITEAFRRCVRDGAPFNEELQLVRQDTGEVRWVNAIGRAERDEHGDVVVVHGALQDITDRIDAQVAAEANRRQLEMIGDIMPFIIWTADPGGEIDYVSQEFWRYTGVLPTEALGDAWISLVHPEDLDSLRDAWEASVATGEPYAVEFRVRNARGAYRWHLTRAVPERDPRGDIAKWWGSSIDIDAVRTLERKASALAHQLNETLESIGDAVLSLDAEWRVTFVNAHAERLLQHPRAELLGRNIWMVFPEAVGSVFQVEYERAVAERRPVAFGAPFEPLDIYAEVSAYPHDNGLTIYFRDVSERRSLDADGHVVHESAETGHRGTTD